MKQSSNVAEQMTIELTRPLFFMVARAKSPAAGKGSSASTAKSGSAPSASAAA